MIFVSLCWQYLRESSFEEELYMWRSFLRHKLVLSCGQAFSCSTPGWFRIVFADQHNHLQLGQFPVYIQPSYAQSFSVSKLGLVVLEQLATSSYIPPPPISPFFKATPTKHINCPTTARSRLFCDSPANFRLLSLLQRCMSLWLMPNKSMDRVCAGRQVS